MLIVAFTTPLAAMPARHAEMIKNGAAEAEAYATAYYGCFGNIERVLLWQWLMKNPAGAQGLYRLKG
ncbi:hypothetical protein [Cloacibacillus sp.]|uniref:hypothetical protein n=1 Tax=Cloacibacillus sp. TaxID=2049023 RepID=UPI0025B7DEA2|nr:hypothetical protein [Cloacibacillus sp.]